MLQLKLDICHDWKSWDGFNERTLQELLASILLEKGLVNYGACHIIDHQRDDWLDLFL